jgi:peptide-methionine (R)-S-oxide reductase
MERRTFLLGLFAAAFAACREATTLAKTEDRTVRKTGDKTVAELQENWKSLYTGDLDAATSLQPVNKSEEEWKKELSPMAFAVLREEGTERPFTSALNDEKRAGIYACAGCSLPLFTSEMKFDSGTGWPSFFTSIPNHLATKTDYKLVWPRTEYHCVRCGGHQGHVFDDGPPPTGQRWCNNGVALKFTPKT